MSYVKNGSWYMLLQTKKYIWNVNISILIISKFNEEKYSNTNTKKRAFKQLKNVYNKIKCMGIHKKFVVKELFNEYQWIDKINCWTFLFFFSAVMFFVIITVKFN